MKRNRGNVERFTVLCVSGIWEESRKESTRAGYLQRQNETARVAVHVVRTETRDRDGKRRETAVQTITGDYGAVASYVDTFPPVMRVTSLRDRSGMVLESTY